MRRRFAILLPPLAVAGALALILTRSVGVGDRLVREASIRARSWNKEDWSEVEKDLDRYVVEFAADPAARWFAAETYARIWGAPKAFDVVWDNPGLAADPSTPQRFAGLMLRTLGGTPKDATTLYWRCLLARLEARDADAREELHELSSRATPQQAAGLYIPAHRVPTEGLRSVAAAFGARTDDPVFPMASAALGICSGDRARADILVSNLHDWPQGELGIWPQAVRAVGASGDPRALDVLRKEQARVRESDPMAGDRRAMLDVGLALAEDPEAVKAVFAAARGASSNSMQSTIYAEGLTMRLSCGDKSALERIVSLWNGPLRFETRLQLAAGCLLADPAPPPELPAAQWLEDLLAGDVPVGRAVAHAYRWRVRGADEAAVKKDILDALRSAVHAAWKFEGMIDGEGLYSSVVMEVLRAWHRWPSPKS